MRFIPLILSALAITACSSPNKPINLVVEQNICCQNFSQLPYITLKDQDDIEQLIDMNSKVALFNNNKSHFAAFRLPDRANEVTITVSSLMHKGSVFAPSIILLDSNFQAVKTIGLTQFETKVSSMFTSTSFVKKLQLERNQTPYFIVYSNQKDLGNVTEVPHPAKLRMQATGEPMPMVTDPKFIHNITGELDLQVKITKFKEVVVANQKPTAAVSHAIKMQPESESYYNEQIEKAVTAKDIKKAMALVDEATKAGSRTAQDHFIKLMEQ